MAEHFLDSVPGTVSNVFSRELPPVLSLDPGDTLTVHTLDCSGHLKRRRTADEDVPRMFGERRGHCLAGPIAVRGAEPGMALAVTLESLRPDAWGFTAAATSDTPLTRRLGLTGEDSEWLSWDLDADRGTGTDQYGHTVSLAPFLGVIGTPRRAGRALHDAAPRPRRRQHRLPRTGRRIHPVPARHRPGRAAQRR